MRIKLGRPMLLRQIAAFSDCTLFFSDEDSCQTAISYLSTDTRELMSGDLFVALQTEKDDGHAYLPEAHRRGASAAMIRGGCISDAPPMCLLTAPDTLDALVQFAVSWAETVPHRTIAVTGSVGKTSTRHLLSCILAERYRVHESDGNFNNLLGTALTLLAMRQESNYLVAECGMDAPGQISRISGVLRPDVSVITGIGISHLEKLKTKEAICRAKLEILDGMPQDGTLYCPSAEPLLCHMTPVTPRTFSAYDSGADYHMENLHSSGFGMRFDLATPNGTFSDLYVPILSEALMPIVSCAAAVALAEGVTEDQLRHGFARYKPLPMRQNILSLGEVLLLVDCYNACPASMKAAGETAMHLQEMTGGRVFALLGDMTELGSATETGHKEIGAYMAHFCQRVYCVGDNASLYAAEAKSEVSSKFRLFCADADREEIAREMVAELQPSDILLIKGSRVCHLETFIPYFRKMLL